MEGRRVYDSTLILAALDARRAEPPLYHPDPAVAARQRFVEDWSDESFYWYLMGLRWAPVNANASAEQVAASVPLPALLRPLVKLLLHRQIGGTARAQGLARLPLDVILAQLGARFDELLVWLGDSPFLFSERPSAADLAVFGQVQTLQSGPTPQGAELVAQRPALVAWLGRVDEATRG
jgi:glutathione S-transferase